MLLARSRPLIAVLVIYPLVLSLLVGGVLGGQGARPRVAFVNEDSIPDVVRVGDRSFDFGRIVREAGKRVELVAHVARARAQSALADGDVVAAIVVPRGFVSDLSSLIVSPTRAAADEPQRLRGADPARDAVVRLHAQHVGADGVHPLEQQLPRRPRERRARPRRSGGRYDVLGLEGSPASASRRSRRSCPRTAPRASS